MLKVKKELKLFFELVAVEYSPKIISRLSLCSFDVKKCFFLQKIVYKALSILSTEKKERRRLSGEKDDGDGGARHKKKRKAKKRWMDLVREDMERIGAREGDKVDGVKWRLLSRCGDPE